jgi:hypothetical protein
LTLALGAVDGLGCVLRGGADLPEVLDVLHLSCEVLLRPAEVYLGLS